MRKTAFLGIFILFFTVSNAKFLFFKDDESKITLRVGVASKSNSEIFNFIKNNFKDEEFELEIVEYSDYIQSNDDLLEDVIDVNYSQNKDYLNFYNTEYNTNIVSYGDMYFERMGIYSKKYSSIKEFKNIVIAIPNIESDKIRALKILENTGLISLNNEYQILENPRNIRLLEISPKYLLRVLEQADSIIGKENEIFQKDDDSLENALYLEEYNEKYTNVLAGKYKSKKKKHIKRLYELLKSTEVKHMIDKKHKGIII
ncbi:MetQ/NlpA family ABC transporter substrate-binding protein [uncultured Ilyobacter sp.]|jgi:D-methionine transport system substrate-binding protein|uniref:MetQ/NlpA family ABC transporter substrate-binding protein n=1 Tax=uncultured Ilyobacter sp. TaxID=544433 RepID=UPI002AA697BE|nr:MetQ/NlpA family ABC transporter substrate-binding protein [uncultured Ilyobacter sp.]